MEYISYILITLGILASCVLMLREPRQRRLNEKLAKTPKEAASQQALHRELKPVPTPWGWPGHVVSAAPKSHARLNAQEVHGVSESLYHFVDRLFHEKQTIDEGEFLLRKNAAMQALLEERYGKASTMQEVKYKKVKPPRLRDPGEPHDQMDNFPSGKLNGIVARIPRQPAAPADLQKQSPLRKSSELKEIRTPWGW
ncbi:hypothetical protein ACFL1C_02975 [Pseudomonadota bacterium]